MNQRLERIGFYTLSDERARTTSVNSSLQRCELILGGSCNFRCGYCRGLSPYANRTLSLQEAKNIVRKWASHDLKNIRFSGGEPTLWPGLTELVRYTVNKNVRRIALSTNGSANPDDYIALVEAGVNDFSVSLDACCAATGDIMSGRAGSWPRIVESIKTIAETGTYITVGVVVNERNVQELRGIIEFAKGLGVSDIRIISAAQDNSRLIVPEVDSDKDYPILYYRLLNMNQFARNVRGIQSYDSHRCKLVLDDMAVANKSHFPCIIYMREGGAPIGSTEQTMRNVRRQRKAWFETHDTYADPICRRNCLDVCIDYNNRCRFFEEGRSGR